MAKFVGVYLTHDMPDEAMSHKAQIGIHKRRVTLIRTAMYHVGTKRQRGVCALLL
jgi:hypothetical protein